MLYMRMLLLLFRMVFSNTAAKSLLSSGDWMGLEDWGREESKTFKHRRIIFPQWISKLWVNEFGKRLFLYIVFQVVTSIHKGKKFSRRVWLNAHTELKRNKIALTSRLQKNPLVKSVPLNLTYFAFLSPQVAPPSPTTFFVPCSFSLFKDANVHLSITGTNSKIVREIFCDSLQNLITDLSTKWGVRGCFVNV